jgi:putative transcriptional regulator
MKSLQGHLLIASPKLLDPNFYRTVMLMVQHDNKGAMGIVLNRPLEISIRKAWKQVSEKPCMAKGFIHHGGPVEGPLIVLHTDQDLSEIPVIEGVHFCTDRNAVEQLVYQADGPMRFYVGYAGWAPGQLEVEIQEGSWLSLPASSDHIFADDQASWLDLMRAATPGGLLPNVNPKCIPEDPSMN